MLKNGPEHKALADVSSELNLSQIIKSPTRITYTCQSLIDIILVSSPLRYIGVLDTPIIDHLPVYALLNYKRPKTSPSYITARSYVRTMIPYPLLLILLEIVVVFSPFFLMEM